MQDPYFRSYYANYTFPDAAVYRRIAEESPRGISVFYRSHYESTYISYGWTLYSTEMLEVLYTGVVSHGSVPGVSSTRRTEIESLLLVVHLLACIYSSHSVVQGKIQIFCFSKNICKIG
jgi:hypothetical protein